MAEHRIERLGLHGDGVAEGPVYVARSLPGEVVTGEIDGGRIARPKILLPSPARVSPPCPHFRACGGCSLQHASDQAVAEFKVQVVRTALQAQGLEADVSLAHTSPRESRRRAVLTGRRTKTGAMVGFHAPMSDVLTEIDGCLVLTPRLIAMMPLFRQITRALCSRRGELKLAVTDLRDGVDLDISGAPQPADRDLAPLVETLREAGLARLTWDGETVVQYAPAIVVLDGVEVPCPPRPFLQATAQAEAALVGLVLDGMEGVGGPVADLFSGIGTFTFPLSRKHPVHAVEGSAEAAQALQSGWRRSSGRQAVTTEVRDLFRRPLLPDELASFAAVVLDPPRAGAAEQIGQLAASDVARVVHVSCNPVTFARDAATLVQAGFAMGPVSVVDQFRWSSHVELVSTFRR